MKVFGRELQLKFRFCAAILVCVLYPPSVFHTARGFCCLKEVLKCSQRTIWIIPNLMSNSETLPFQARGCILSINVFFYQKTPTCTSSFFFTNIFPICSPAAWSLNHLSIYPSLSLQSLLFFSYHNRMMEVWWSLVLSWSCFQLAQFPAKLLKPHAITLHIYAFDVSIMDPT